MYQNREHAIHTPVRRLLIRMPYKTNVAQCFDLSASYDINGQSQWIDINVLDGDNRHIAVLHHDPEMPMRRLSLVLSSDSRHNIQLDIRSVVSGNKRSELNTYDCFLVGSLGRYEWRFGTQNPPAGMDRNSMWEIYDDSENMLFEIAFYSADIMPSLYADPAMKLRP